MKNRRLLSLIMSPSVVLASGVSWAQQAPVFEEVLVTAEKRTESLQNLSQAVTALSAEDLENRQLNSFVDLSAIAPGVNVAKNEGFKTVITIRGIGNEANQNAIANPPCLYHLDGVYVASPFALQTDFSRLWNASRSSEDRRAPCSARTPPAAASMSSPKRPPLTNSMAPLI